MGYGLAQPSIFAVPDGPARYAKRPTGPCLGQRSGPQTGKARPAGHDVPPRPVRLHAGPAQCRAGPAGPLPRWPFGHAPKNISHSSASVS